MNTATTITVTPLITALCGLMLVALGVRTLLLRRKLSIGIGADQKDGTPSAPLARAIRAHGNFAEYVPTALIVLAMLEIRGGSSTTLWVLGIVLLIGRVIHAIGISRENEDYRFRVVGVAMTFTVLIGGSLRLLGTYL